jgi:hypothetical protein
LVTISTIAVLVIGAGLIIAAYTGWDVGTGDHDKCVTVTLAVTIAAAVLGAVAAVLALVAFLAASGTPELRIKIRFTFCEPNEAVFKVGPPRRQSGWIPIIEPMKQGLAQVELYNESAYSAHNPGVRIQLMGISVADRYRPPVKGTLEKAVRNVDPNRKADHVISGWAALKSVNMIGPTVYQWDGGADQIIHGNWSRSLPPFDLCGAHIIAGASAVMLRVSVVADGVSPIHQEIKIKTLNAAQWNEWVVDRSMPVETGAIVLRELATPLPEPARDSDDQAGDTNAQPTAEQVGSAEGDGAGD